MGRFAVVSCVLVAAVASCFFKPDPPGHGPNDAAGDSAEPDGPTTCGSACAWGCVDGAVPHCGTFTPASGAIVPADFDTTTLADANVPSGTIDGDTGAFGSLRGAGSGVINGIDYHLAGNVAVFRVKSLQITGGVTLAGRHPIAIVAGGAISVGATIDATGTCSGTSGGPGGYAGGAANSAAIGSGGGSVTAGNGGGGGGHGGTGGVGTAKNGTAPTVGGAAFGDDTMLVGGGGGGGGGGASAGTGGGGGGALELVSNTAITIASGGTINAGGCGAPQTGSFGGGGGAGGTIMLEAPVVTVDGALAVNGGGGAAGGNGGSGSGANGRSDRTPAPGGIGPGGFTSQNGGSGAAGAMADGYANGQISTQGGGGGGAIGRIRITTRTGNVGGSGSLSPAPADSTTAHAYTAVVH
jgi:hypothetical protein